jgi:ABC-2 type transport system ATP-binding protein
MSKRNHSKPRARLAYVPDFPFLYEKLTPLGVFSVYRPRIFDGRCQDRRTRARVWSSGFNLEPFANKPIEGLSHGTRQRVAIVSALLP